MALRRLLARARATDGFNRTVNRKNSLDRVTVEAIVIEALKEAGHLNSSELKRRLSAAMDSVNENTFRSYLHRMKLAGQIAQYRKQRGVWTVVDHEAPSAP